MTKRILSTLSAATLALGVPQKCAASTRSSSSSAPLVPSAAVDCVRDRYPFCIVWSPLPMITWLCPIIGHRLFRLGLLRSGRRAWLLRLCFPLHRHLCSLVLPTGSEEEVYYHAISRSHYRCTFWSSKICSTVHFIKTINWMFSHSVW